MSSKLYVDSIEPKTTGGNVTVTNFVKSGGEKKGTILEQLCYVCNGDTVTVDSGTYTAPNVTAPVALTDSYVDIAASIISYTPPSGTANVIYEFNYVKDWENTSSISHVKFFIDSNEVTQARQTTGGGADYHESRYTFQWRIPVGGSANTASGRLASWSSAKTLKMQIRRYSSSYDGILFKRRYFDGSSADGSLFEYPSLKITSIS